MLSKIRLRPVPWSHTGAARNTARPAHPPKAMPSLLSGLSVVIPMVGSFLIAKRLTNSWAFCALLDGERDQVTDCFHPVPLHRRRLAFEYGVDSRSTMFENQASP